MPRRSLLLALLLSVVACGGPQQSALERIRETGVVRIGYANEAPYAYVDDQTGRLTGETPEIARAVLKKLGAERVEGVLTEFGALIPGLKARRFDVIAAGMYITPKRCREIAFSNPTYRIGEAFLVKAGNPLDLHSYQDVEANESARLGVVTGSVELAYARAMGIPDERIALLPDPPSAVAAVRAGRVDAYAGTRLTVADMLGKAEEGLERAAPFVNPIIDGRAVYGYGAFGVRRDDVQLLQALNEALADFLGTDAHLALVAPFGFGEATLPGGVTAAELCGSAPSPASGS